MEFIVYLLALAALVLPIILVIINIVNIFNRGNNKLFIHRRKYSNAALVSGFFLVMFVLLLVSEYKWNEPIVLGTIDFTADLHEPFSRDYAVSLAVFAVISILSVILLDREEYYPPLFASMLTGGVYVGMIFWIMFSVQLLQNISLNFLIWYLLLYAANYLICSIRVLREAINRYTAFAAEHKALPDNKLLKKLWVILGKASGFVWFSFVCIIPVIGVAVIICLLFGQGAFGAIKAFTETSDWTFSTMVSPPPIPYEGHYLCTVAVNGHDKLVKPTRMGVRHGEKIVVNRQLCIANAFEQLIEDKAPKFHKAVRAFYDKYGYPISKHITTKLRADIVYVIMKPLEWLFLITLYLFDATPESRIALQYTGKKISDFCK